MSVSEVSVNGMTTTRKSHHIGSACVTTEVCVVYMVAANCLQSCSDLLYITTYIQTEYD